MRWLTIVVDELDEVVHKISVIDLDHFGVLVEALVLHLLPRANLCAELDASAVDHVKSRRAFCRETLVNPRPCIVFTHVSWRD